MKGAYIVIINSAFPGCTLRMYKHIDLLVLAQVIAE